MPNIHTPQELDPAAAFEAMGQRLAGLTAAIDGLAVKFQEMHARDYSPEFAKVEGQFQAVRGAVKNFTELPAMVLTPEKIAAQVEAAGRDGRLADHQAWERARSDLRAATASINGVVASARTGQAQTKRMKIGAGTAFVIGGLLMCVALEAIPWIAPVGWHWPEERAAKILGRDKWNAGVRLLEVADPAKWQQLKAASSSVEGHGAETAESASRKANQVGIGRAKGHRFRVSK
ncbi:hypothetical protein EDF57_1218 [Novosphingobium sp. PhB55]|uniref:DUF6118 family protein n=1 Tax=Novosphingobium sp. PhB55 TaxID=2485106 RepID=UPI001065DE27|nr:DUF6118 family protein [Novosphingobium sp. PhB55]TDW58626.1 hypothetical protein EDF57_1218 [Novosphingobium sp. PhB55]